MQIKTPKVITKFDVSHLSARRTFVFARAGFGKSNLIKLLFSNLYLTTRPSRSALVGVCRWGR